MDKVRICSDEQEVGMTLVSLICERAERACRERGTFRCALSGGSLIGLLARGEEALVQAASSGPRWRLFLADERWCPPINEDSTWGEYKRRMPHFLEATDFQSPYQEDGDLEMGAARYDQILTTEGPLDLVILGVGPDGHTASLFPPVTNAMLECQRFVIPIDNSPKPPLKRITFSLSGLLGGHTRELLFVVTGASKAEILQRIIIQRDKSLPTGYMVGLAYWLADNAAAAHLPPVTN